MIVFDVIPLRSFDSRGLVLGVYKVLVNRTAFVKATIFVYTLQAQEGRH